MAAMAAERSGRVAELLRDCATLESTFSALPSDVIPADSRRRLCRMVHNERRFLLSLASGSVAATAPRLASSNLIHLEAIALALHNPFISGVSAVMHSFQNPKELEAAEVGVRRGACFHSAIEETVHVDAVCIFRGWPSWVVVFSCNPNALCFEIARGKRTKSMKERVVQLMVTAGSVKEEWKPQKLVLFFAAGISQKMVERLEIIFLAQRIPNEDMAGNSGTLRDADGEWQSVMALDTASSVNFERKETSGGRNAFAHQLDNSQLAVGVEEDESFAFREVEDEEWLLVDCRNHGQEASTSLAVDCEPKHAFWSMQRLASSQTAVWLEISCTLDNLERCGLGLNCVDAALLNSDNAPVSDGALKKKSMEEKSEGGTPEGNVIVNMINLDTTALVAMVSELSNGSASSVLDMSMEQLECRFPKMASFILEQAESEKQRPLLPEIEAVLAGKSAIICQSVFTEFSNIVALVGGPREQRRAAACLARMRVVPDQPSARVAAMAETGRVKARHKAMAGTGDTWRAPTLTANAAFVRAARQAGVPLAVVAHRPRALTGD